MSVQVIEADLVWTGAGFERGLQISIASDGRIAGVGKSLGAPTRSLQGRALLPGFVSAHSHSFQRGLRGKGERFAAGAGSFWTWREAMYDLVGSLDAQTLHALSLQAFREMLAAGITSVGEFQYLHHDASCKGFAMDEVVLGAAREAGIRIALLSAFYSTGGIGRPLSGPQRRFQVKSVDEYLAHLDGLAKKLDPATQSLGLVAHSIRAAPLEAIVAIHQESRRRGLVFHMHIGEQRKEIEDCRLAYGRAPSALLCDHLELDERFTAVHCTHTEPAHLARLAEHGATICICPLTEANLGDGIADVPAMLAHGARLALGTDSNARISMLEEMRWLEYVQRLAREKRGVCLDSNGEVARTLLAAATKNGARSLGLETGEIRAGLQADLVAIDLGAPSLAGASDDDLLDALVFGAGDRVIREVCVGGRFVA